MTQLLLQLLKVCSTLFISQKIGDEKGDKSDTEFYGVHLTLFIAFYNLQGTMHDRVPHTFCRHE